MLDPHPQPRLRHFEPVGCLSVPVASTTGQPQHPNDIAWVSLGRSWPGLKQAYSILWRRQVFSGGGRILGSRTMALILHCGWGTEAARVAALERMGLLHVVRGSSRAGGAEEDRPNIYRLASRQVEQQSDLVVDVDLLKQYTRLQEPFEQNPSMDLLLDMAPPPDQDRWRQERFGAIGWLIAADPLADEAFTVADMAERLGLSTDAVRRCLDKFAAAGMVERLPGGRSRLTVPVELNRDVRQDHFEWLVHDPHAARDFLRRTADEDTSISDRQLERLMTIRRDRAKYSTFIELQTLSQMPGRRLNGKPLLPVWTRAYNLTHDGWRLRGTAVVDAMGWPMQEEIVALSETFTHRPRIQV